LCEDSESPKPCHLAALDVSEVGAVVSWAIARRLALVQVDVRADAASGVTSADQAHAAVGFVWMRPFDIVV
jgi:hypothetical protein